MFIRVQKFLLATGICAGAAACASFDYYVGQDERKPASDTTSPAQASGLITPSHDPYPGCHWQRFVSPELGVRMFVQACSDPTMNYLFSVHGTKIEQHRVTDDTTFGQYVVMEVFSKAASQSLIQALEQNVSAQLPNEARQSCRVEPLENPPLQRKQIQVVTLKPTGNYLKKIEKDLQSGPRDLGCGSYGAGQQTTYFEFHPSESATKFAFVNFGWEGEHPLFDENSIEFF